MRRYLGFCRARRNQNVLRVRVTSYVRNGCLAMCDIRPAISLLRGPVRGGGEGDLCVLRLNFEFACVAISEVLRVAVRISLSTLLLVLSLS